MEAKTIYDLPDELIVLIFSYLPLSGRKCTRLVCRHWYALCDSVSLIKDDVLSVKFHQELDQCTTYRKNLNLRIEGYENPLKEIKFWKNSGPEVKAVELFLVKHNSPILNSIFNYCGNLQFLSLSSLDANDCIRKIPPFSSDKECNSSPILNHLLSLDLIFMRHITGADIDRLTKHAPKLKRFGLITPGKRVLVYRPCVLPSVIELIRRQSSILVELDFTSCTFLDDDALETILNEIGPQLTGIYLPRCPLGQNPISFSKRIPNLKEIDLSCILNLTIDGFSTLFKSLKKLAVVSLQETYIDSDVLSLVLDLEDLKALDISKCKYLTSDGLIRAFTRRPLPKMHDLRLNFVRSTCDSVIEKISSSLPNLKHLQLNSCRNITALSLSSLSINCKLLRTLTLRYCKKINDNEITVDDFLNCFKGLIHLDLFGCEGLSSKTIGKLQLMELQTIDVSDVDVTQAAIDSLLASCPSIQRIHLDSDKNTQVLVEMDPIMKTPVLAYGFCPFQTDSIFD